MMENMGFSWLGLLYLILLLVPNLFWTRYPPAGYDPTGENRLLRLLERIGEVCVSVTVLIFQDPPFSFSPAALLLIGSLILMALYEFWWLRYFRSSRQQTDFYRSLCGIPVAGATLPVLAFLLLSLYRRSFWLFLSVLVLGIGHIGIHLQHRREMDA